MHINYTAYIVFKRIKDYCYKFNKVSNNMNLLLYSGKQKNASEEESMTKRFYGPPTSCEELQKLGYTLNGYYLIKGKDKLDANRIQVVFCQFQQQPGTKSSNFIS